MGINIPMGIKVHKQEHSMDHCTLLRMAYKYQFEFLMPKQKSNLQKC